MLSRKFIGRGCTGQIPILSFVMDRFPGAMVARHSVRLEVRLISPPLLHHFIGKMRVLQRAAKAI
jgi:hypothetical protein